MSEQKNQKMLINAFNNINREIDEYKLVIYGNGELKEELIDLTKKLKIEDNLIKGVKIKTGNAQIQLKLKEEYNRALKFVYYVEV